MSEPIDSNPTRGIRAVFLVGFLTGNACGFVYLAVAGHLWDSVASNPLALIGAFLGIGLAGALIAGMAGLALRLMLVAQNDTAGLRAPVVVAAASSATTGLLISYFIVAALWGN